MKRYAILLALGLAMTLGSASAHKESDAYLTLSTDAAQADRLHLRWDIALRDLAFVIDLDSNHDTRLTWGEVQAHFGDIQRYALSRLTVSGDGLICAAQAPTLRIADHSDGAYAVLLFDAVCDKDIPSTLRLDYRLFVDVDPYHRGIVTMRSGANTSNVVLGPDQPSASLRLGTPDRGQQFSSFLKDGVWHIWTGPDHLLFVFSLLLPAVLIRRASPRGGSGLVHLSWTPQPRLSRAMIELIKVVTGFTLSHSLTLTASVLGYVHLPSRLVESGIALSIIVAALNNVFPIIGGRPWQVAFCFGFIHGLGFASALAGLQLPPLSMAIAIAGFSLGVELGQEAIVLPFIPLAFWMRDTRFYQQVVLRWGSIAIVMIATLWLAQRAFDLTIPGTAWLTPP